MAGGSVNGMLLNAAQDYLNRRAHRGVASAQNDTENRKLDIMEGQGDEQRQSMLDRIKLQADHALALQAMKNQGALEKQTAYNQGTNDVSQTYANQRHMDEMLKQNSAHERLLEEINSKQSQQMAKDKLTRDLADLKDARERAIAADHDKTGKSIAVINGEYKNRYGEIMARAASMGLDGKILDVRAGLLRAAEANDAAARKDDKFLPPQYQNRDPAAQVPPRRQAVEQQIQDIKKKGSGNSSSRTGARTGSAGPDKALIKDLLGRVDAFGNKVQ